MPAFLILHSSLRGTRADAFRMPPMLDVDGLRAPLDWGDVTLQVPPGDIRVTTWVVRLDSRIEGASLTVRVPRGTGTRLTFEPPPAPGISSTLRIDGQWPSDASMHYYAARDGRFLAPPTASAPAYSTIDGALSTPTVGPGSPATLGAARASDRRAPRPTEPAVGPGIGSTGSVPSASAFGEAQGAHVEPSRPRAGAAAGAPVPGPPVQRQGVQGQGVPGQGLPGQGLPGQGLPRQGVPDHGLPGQGVPGQGVQAQPPSQPGPGLPQQRPSFGQPPHQVPRDLYGRPLPDTARGAAPIPTPAEFSRLEREAVERQRAAYEAWQAQHATVVPAHGNDRFGVPEPLRAPGTGGAQQGWYPDPFRRSEQRWFDGRQWTSSVMRQGRRESDPL